MSKMDLNATEQRYMILQCSPLNSNSRGPTKCVLIMRCSIYEFAFNIKCKYNSVNRDHNHLSELTEPESRLHCTIIPYTELFPVTVFNISNFSK